VPNHAGDLSRATGHLRAAVAKRRGRPPAAPFLLQGGGRAMRLIGGKGVGSAGVRGVGL
jgi:hypothetical protein